MVGAKTPPQIPAGLRELCGSECTRGRGEVLGQAGVAEACAYTLEGVSKNQKKVR